jgi:hypothetical protein
MIRAEAGVDSVQAKQALSQQTSGRQQHKRHGKFGDD